MPYRVVLVTAGSKDEGEKLARGVVQEKLAACVNLVPGIKSLYWWEGKIEEADEVLLIMKTTHSRVEALIGWVVSHHSYSVPEVVTLKIEEGNSDYLSWVHESVGSDE